MFLLLIPTLLSVLVLAAHFFRADQTAMMTICLLSPVFLLLRRAWATRLVQLVLVLGALEWVRTTLQIHAVRVEEGRDWLRMSIILLSVAAFTFASALTFFLPAFRRHYCSIR